MDSRYRDIVRSDAGLVGYWKLDGDYVDEKNANNGSSISGTFVTGIVGPLACNCTVESGHHVSIPNSTDYDFGTTTDFSVEFFVKPAENNRIQLYVDRRANNTSGFVCYVTASNNAAIILTGSTIDSGLGIISGTNKMHVIYSVDRNASIKTFINGNANTVNISTNTVNISVSSVLSFGARAFTQTTTTMLNGQIDEVSIYNRALTQADATARYSAYAANDRPWINTGLNGRGG